MPTVNLIVKGKVQGVFYRASARKNAETLSITGWVKNVHNGDVEIMATGTENNLSLFIDWCRQGPGNAVVTGFIKTEEKETRFDSFTVEH